MTALGNHDILRNKRTVAAWARVYGQESQNFSVDLDFARVILIGPNRTDPGKRAGRLSERTLAFLERELDEGPDDCWIACHYPLFRTVMGDPRRHFTSAMAAFHAKPDDRIRELLARHRNARVWLSGHTHSPLSAPGFVKRARLAARTQHPGDQHVGAVRPRQAPEPARPALLPLPDAPPGPPRDTRPRPPGSRLAEHPRPARA